MTQASTPASFEAGLARIGEMIILSRGARALTSAVALGVFDQLAAGPRSADEVARAIPGDPRATRILLDALVALDLLSKSGEAYANSPLASRFLVSDAPQSLASNFHYQELLAHAWADLPEVVRTGRPQRSLEKLLSENPRFTRNYIRGMSDIARRPAQELAERLDLSRVRAMLDVGAGPGAYSEAVLRRAPHARAVLLDLAPTLEVAREVLAGSPVRERIELREGDYHRADYGREAFDLVLFSHVTHDEGETQNQAMLTKSFAALRPGGQVVIHDFMLDTDRTRPLFGALFSLHMLVYTQQGRTYSAEEYGGWLRGCGFVNPRRFDICPRSPNPTQALVGTKP